MGFLSRWFGDEGTVRFKGTTIDGATFEGKTKIESFNNSTEEIEEHLKEKLFVETGRRVKELKIIGFSRE